ncbi:hypothetical protein Syun_012389 [Stephania yunnanensis]|uniref:Uncharacterized protein n=1 Tax=Stephania yunnanensis TaxID=152371 RepID=A0AAP0PHG7_9MAGN
MGTVADSESKPELQHGENPLEKNPGSLQVAPWTEYVVQQAQFFQKTLENTIDSTAATARTRFSEIQSTSSAHLDMTLDSLRNVKSEYDAYEDALFRKMKEGIYVAASHPAVTIPTAIGVGVLGLKKPRRFISNGILRLFVSEEALISRADAKLKELQKSIELVKAESEKLEGRFLQAEDEMKRGRTKLRQAGNQIQGVIQSAYKIERQARGLKDILGELPSRQATQFRSQVSNLASEVKQERNALSKEVSRISNYGISV